ncbi:DASH complex subunit Dad3p [Trichomonascus vanleenenianus]|uniref:Dad3p n=1 Tax=Trichomonascus vanleenenianus TaxID=2268995 RepID=UPI003ECAF151
MEMNEQKGQEVSEIEQELLDEYKRLSLNLKKLSQSVHRLAVVPTPQILETLRTLESKISLVSTLLKASVYSIFIQQEQGEQMQEDEEEDTGTAY